MVAPAPFAPSSLAGPSAPGRRASRIAFDRRGATQVSPENAVFEHLAHRRDHAPSAPCIGRARPHRRDSHWGRRRFSGHTRIGRYCRARYYHPGLHRFIGEDPIGFLGGDPNLYAYVSNAPVNFVDPSGMYLAPGTIPQHCRDPLTIPLTPELSGRKGLLAQIVASELTALGIAWDALACTSILPTPAAGIVGGARGGAQGVANATRLARQLTGEAQVAELLAGGGRVIAGPGSKVPLRDAARLVREYGGAAENWVKVTSTRPSVFQTHAYRNVVTGQVVEPKTNLMLQNVPWWW